jgi:hypothetical protein
VLGRNWETEHYNSFLEITVSFLGIHKWEFAVERERVIQYSELFSRFERSFCQACTYHISAEIFLSYQTRIIIPMFLQINLSLQRFCFFSCSAILENRQKTAGSSSALFWHCGFSTHILLYAVCACLQHIFKYFLLYLLLLLFL